jgi:hypothetical protein
MPRPSQPPLEYDLVRSNNNEALEHQALTNILSFTLSSSKVQSSMLQRTILQRTHATTNSFYQSNQDVTQ